MLEQRITMALLAGAMALLSPLTWAASCCGGGSSSSLVLPKFAHAMVAISSDVESYDGFWDGGGNYTPDPPGSRLNQYRLNLGYAYRLGSRWQASINLPYVWNSNQYAGLDSSTQGLGDGSINIWYEAFDGITCIWKVRKWQDLKPAIYLGAALTVPTGISPYDDVANSFDITGRGMYRLDGSVLLEKTIYPWNASLLYVYGKYLARDVNREYGKYIEPYQKQLGDRQLATASGGYTYFLESMDTVTFTLAYSYLQEAAGTIDGRSDASSRMQKRSFAGTVAFSTMDRDWVIKGTWSHARPEDGWGKNFPVTDIISLGVSHVFR
jgi:hypothetical protein